MLMKRPAHILRRALFEPALRYDVEAWILSNDHRFRADASAKDRMLVTLEDGDAIWTESQ